MAQETKERLHPIDAGISIWSGLALHFSDEWNYYRSDDNWFTCAVDPTGVVFYRSHGWGFEADYDALSDILQRILLEMKWEGRPWVLINDCTEFTGMDISARKKLIDLLVAQKSLKGIAFCTPSHLIKSLVQMAIMFYHPSFEVVVCKGWEQGCLKASEWLGLLETQSISIPETLPEMVPQNVGVYNKDVDMVLQCLGSVEWDKPGIGDLEDGEINTSWKPFLKAMSLIKSDLDNLIAKRELRLAELHESTIREIALQKQMSQALEQSQRVRKVFELEAKRNLNLSRVVIDTQKETLFALGEIIESRSRETANHIRRVAEYSTLLAWLKGMSEREQQHILHASPMHDAGKIAIPDAILNKPGKLTVEEFEIMKGHSRLGWEMLNASRHEIMVHAATIAYQHHEKWNGKGYPNGLRGEETHVFGRIVALADVFDALGSDRCYKKAWPLEKVLDLIQSESNEHFDPGLVTLFFNNLGEFLKIRERFPDAAP